MTRTTLQKTLRSRANSALPLVVVVLALAGAFALIDYDFGLLSRERDNEAATTVLSSTIGATVEPLDRRTAEGLGMAPQDKGVVITSIERNGPAAQVGIKVGDVIEKVGATPVVSTSGAATALGNAHEADIELLLNRSGRYVTVHLPIPPTTDEGGGLPEQGGGR